MFGVRNRFLFEETRHVAVMKRVDDLSAISASDHQAHQTKNAELVRNSACSISTLWSQLPHRDGPVAQSGQDADPARSRQRLHCVGNLLSTPRVN